MNKIKVGITGAGGLLGWHMHAFLHNCQEIEVFAADRDTFAEQPKLEKFVSSCDVIFHFAGLNRGDNEEVIKINVGIAKQLVDACMSTDSKPHLIFSSSTHIYKNTAYGKSKMRCSEIFLKWANKNGGTFTNLLLPNIFGEKGKPFHNSVVSTFSYQLANGQEAKIIKDVTLELIHAQDVTAEIFKFITMPKLGDVSFSGTFITVSDLLVKLKYFSDIYRQQIIPDLRNKFDLQLFNTYRSYLYPEYKPVDLTLRTDERGCLYEAIKSNQGGQVFISSTQPGVTRGNHYHTYKLERFLVIKGRALICLRKLFSDEIMKFEVNGDKPSYIDIPTLHAHNIKNIGNEALITLFWSHEIFDPNNEDTYPEKV